MTGPRIAVSAAVALTLAGTLVTAACDGDPGGTLWGSSVQFRRQAKRK